MKFKIKNDLIQKSATQRLHCCRLPIIALTGGIATGKSSVSKLIQDIGIETICADKLIKNIYSKTASKNWIKNNFPDCFQNDKINFSILRSLAFQDQTVRNSLENFLYPQLEETFNSSLEVIEKKKAQNFIIYDIPLLFEKKYNNYFDKIICVYAPEKEQLKRLISRDGIADELAKQMIASQIDIEDKKKLCDFIIENCSNQLTQEIVKQFLRKNILLN